MNIEQWKQIIEEFGGSACKRVLLKQQSTGEYIDLLCNEDIYYLDINRIILKPKSELITHDIKDYGSNAYLMWFYDCDNSCPCGDKTKLQCTIKSNDDLLKALDVWEYRLKRKTSAALPIG